MQKQGQSWKLYLGKISFGSNKIQNKQDLTKNRDNLASNNLGKISFRSNKIQTNKILQKQGQSSKLYLGNISFGSNKIHNKQDLAKTGTILQVII